MGRVHLKLVGMDIYLLMIQNILNKINILDVS